MKKLTWERLQLDGIVKKGAVIYAGDEEDEFLYHPRGWYNFLQTQEGATHWPVPFPKYAIFGTVELVNDTNATISAFSKGGWPQPTTSSKPTIFPCMLDQVGGFANPVFVKDNLEESKNAGPLKAMRVLATLADSIPNPESVFKSDLVLQDAVLSNFDNTALFFTYKNTPLSITGKDTLGPDQIMSKTSALQLIGKLFSNPAFHGYSTNAVPDFIEKIGQNWKRSTNRRCGHLSTYKGNCWAWSLERWISI